MKTIRQLSIAIILTLLCLPLATGCKSGDEAVAPPAKEELDIDVAYRTVELDRASGTINVPVNTNQKLEKLQVSQEGTWFVASLKGGEEGKVILELKVRENTTGKERTGTATVKTESKLMSKVVTIKQYGDSQIAVASDIQIKPVAGFASSCENSHWGNYGIEKSFDGDFETHYHSPWEGTAFPVILEYKFSGQDIIDYLIYYTRNGNGNFGEVTIYTATDASRTYEKLGDFDFGGKSTPSSVQIPGGKKITGVKFEVKSGFNDYASCAEMEFYHSNTTNPLNDKLNAVFTDLSCSQLKPGVTDEQIDDLGSFFARVARALRDNTYDPFERDFRIQTYEPYSNPIEWRHKLMVRTYSQLDNPTGITIKEGEEIIVCVGPTHGQGVSLMAISEEKVTHERGDYYQPTDGGDTYMLREGVNKLTMKGDGQLFLLYNTNDITSPDAKPITVHFPLGTATVNGYFDLKRHATDEKYAEILSKAKYKYFCMKGERVILYFSRIKLPNLKITGALKMWDTMARWEQEFTGIEDYRGEGKPFNNHLFCMSPEANNGQLLFWTSDNRMAYVWTTFNDILKDQETISKLIGGTWGVSHEFGHVHQMAIDWTPSTETSANLMAHYVTEMQGTYASHGPGLYRLASVKASKEPSWYDICKNSESYNHINNRMWWQLYVYYHKTLGRKDFYKKVFQEMRNVNIWPGQQNGRKQLEFAKACSKAAGENLWDFFDLWGFFTVVNHSSDVRDYAITTSMVNEVKEYMEQFPKPKHAFEYIEDRKAVGYLDGDFKRSDIGDVGFFETYKANTKLASDISATVSGRNVKVANGSTAVAFEVRKTNASGKLVYFNNFYNFDVPSGLDISGCVLCAVQADGERREIGKF